MTEYKVFISHKEADEASAIAIRDALAMFSGDLTFFISGQNITAGENWQTRLRSELKESNLLMLLFTEPTRDWDWCLYEAGLFTKLDGGADDPVVCIYPPDSDQPNPIAGLQGVPGTIDDVARFVRSFITTVDLTKRGRPLNPNVTEEQVTAAAVVICKPFEAHIQPYYTCHRVLLDLSVVAGTGDSIPPEARIVEASEGTMALFGRLGGTRTWGELVESHTAARAHWLDELNRVFSDACVGRVSSVTTHTFRAQDGAHIFRPELYRIDKKGRTPTAAVVMFTREVAPARVGGALFNRLRVAERYKAEVFERLKTLGTSLSDDDVTVLSESIMLIKEEAKTFNVFDEETLRTSFSDHQACAELVSIGAEWDKNVDRANKARGANDSEDFRSAVVALEALNSRYRAIVAARYSDLLNGKAIE